jgi:hypothetical protein
VCCSCIFGAMPRCNAWSTLHKGSQCSMASLQFWFTLFYGITTVLICIVLWHHYSSDSQCSMASLQFWSTIIPSYCNITCKLDVDEGKRAEVSNHKKATSSHINGTSQQTYLINSKLFDTGGWMAQCPLQSLLIFPKHKTWFQSR